MDNFKELVKQNLNIDLDDEKIKKLDLYYDFLYKTNQEFNLTKITDKNEVYIKHFYDSLLGVKMLDLESSLSLLDIGSGAGFPGLVLAICFSNLQIYLVESITKKATFLKNAVELLNLKNVTVLNERVEKLNILVDICTARAVTDTKTLLNYASKIVKKDGICLFYKSNKVYEELKEFNNSNYKGFKLEKIMEDELLQNYGKRINVVFKKI